MFQSHFDRNNLHDAIHRQLSLDNITTYHRDFLCNSCYPSELPVTPVFQNFWDWISSNYLVIEYTRYIQQHFKEAAYSTTTTEIDHTIRNIVFSIRYADLELIDYTILRQNFINAYSLTEGF
jgi:hypothetical protein